MLQTGTGEMRRWHHRR